MVVYKKKGVIMFCKYYQRHNRTRDFCQSDCLNNYNKPSLADFKQKIQSTQFQENVFFKGFVLCKFAILQNLDGTLERYLLKNIQYQITKLDHFASVLNSILQFCLSNTPTITLQLRVLNRSAVKAV